MKKWLFKISMRDGREYNVFFANKSQKNKIIHFINTRSVVNYELIDWLHECYEFLWLIKCPLFNWLEKERLWIKLA